MLGDNNPTLLGQVLLFLTTLAGFAFQAWREARNRRWAKEEREDLAKKVEEQRQELTSKIDENTVLTARGVEASREAIRVGNNFNAKLQVVMGRFDALGDRERQRQSERIERIDATTQETNDISKQTNDRVRDIVRD